MATLMKWILGLILLLTVPVASHANPQEDELFYVAQKAFDDGFYDVATRYIEQFQQKYPSSSKSVQAKLLLGQCYFFKNQYLKAFDIFKGLNDITEFKDATLFWLGETYFKGGDFKQAAQNYQQLINAYANSTYVPQAYYSLGWTYFEQGQYQEAQDNFIKLLSRFPSHPLSEEAAFKIGEASYQKGDKDKAIKYYRDFISLYPKSSRIAEANFFIAESYYSAGDYLLAVNFYAQTAERAFDPKLTTLAKLGMGWAYLKLGKYDLAEKSFEQADQIAQEKKLSAEDIYLGLASLYTESEQFAKARDMFDKVVIQFASSPRAAEAYLGKANSDYAEKNYPQAISSYQTIIDRYSQDPVYADVVEKAHYGLAWTYLKSGRSAEAIQSFQSIAQRSTSQIARVSALTQIGDAYQEMDQPQKAIEIYDQILREYPDSLYADYTQFQQGIALLRSNRVEAATLSFQSLQTHFPKSKYLSEVQYYLGLAYYKKEDWDQAIRALRNYLDDPNEQKAFIAESTYLLGLSYFNQGKFDLALNVFQKMQKNNALASAMAPLVDLYQAKSLFGLGKTKEGIERFIAVTQKFPGTEAAAEALLRLAEHYLDERNFSSAINYFETFIDFFPGSNKIDLVFYELGQAYQGDNKLDIALKAYHKVRPEADKELFAKAKLAIADIFSKDMDTQTAVATYRNIAQSVPEFKQEALLRIVEIFKNAREYGPAIQTLEETLKDKTTLLNSQAAAIQFEIGDTFELMGDPAKATEAYLKISYLYPQEKRWVIKSYLRLGRIFEDSAQWEQAATIYNKVVVFDVDESKYAKERLEWIAANSHAVRPTTQ